MASQTRYRSTYFFTPSRMTHEAYSFWNGTLFNKANQRIAAVKLTLAINAWLAASSARTNNSARSPPLKMRCAAVVTCSISMNCERKTAMRILTTCLCATSSTIHRPSSRSAKCSAAWWLAPLQERLCELNEWAGEEVVSFKPYELLK